LPLRGDAAESFAADARANGRRRAPSARRARAFSKRRPGFTREPAREYSVGGGGRRLQPFRRA
jgi:hypothetical protein